MNIIVNIEAGEKDCGKCDGYETDEDEYVWCRHFEKSCLNFSAMQRKRFKERGSDEGKKIPLLSCPECLAAEQKLKDLVAACEGLGWMLAVYPHIDLSGVGKALAAIKDGGKE